MRRARRGGGNGLEAWPGYVDALSTLLMVIIFVLLVFVLAQAFLSVALSGRDQALDRVNRQLAELSDMLSVERGRSAELTEATARLNRDLRAAEARRQALAGQLSVLQDANAHVAAERDTLRTERDRLAAQATDATQQAQAAAGRADQLQTQLTEAAGRTEAVSQEAARTAADLAEAKRQLAEMQRQAAALDRTVQTDRATMEARLSDIAKLAEQVRALTALRDELERQAQTAAAATADAQTRRAAVEGQLATERTLGDSARAQIALLNRQIAEMREQMRQASTALAAAQAGAQQKDTQIADLGQKLNAALAAKVEELQRYRSEFFGRLRTVLANRPGVQVVGDRFVFQSEVLFPVGSADITAAGQDQIRALAGTIKQVSAEIPAGIAWILRVDGHADRQKLDGGRYGGNWELSAARAIAVVKLLIAEGVPAEHLAATGFADFQPLDTGDTPEAYAKNRRIELRLTDR
jgi:chemotaxis protein MotB